MHIVLKQFGVVVRHLFEMRHDPALVNRIAVKASGKLVVYAAASHFLQRRDEYVPQSLVAGISILVNQEIDRRRMRELRCAAEAAVARVEHLERGLHNVIDHSGRKLPFCSGVRFRMRDRAFH